MTAPISHKIRTVYRALAIKIFILTVVFLGVPIIFYRLFQMADVQQSELLQQTVEQKGSLIAAVLRPHLVAFEEEPPDTLQHALDELVTDGANIKILVRQEGSLGSHGFLYVASVPVVNPEYLEQERAKLISELVREVQHQLEDVIDAQDAETIANTLIERARSL